MRIVYINTAYGPYPTYEFEVETVASLPEDCIGTPAIGFMQRGVNGESPVVVVAWTDSNHDLSIDYLSVDFPDIELSYIGYP